jgi:hypothetical protein
MKSLLIIIFIIPTVVLSQRVVLNEIMSSNTSVVFDEDFDSSDWIELYNADSIAVDLKGYGLSDDSLNVQKWIFEDKILQPGEHFLIFASGKDRREAPAHWETIITEGDLWKYIVSSADIPANWIDHTFNDSLWEEGPSGFGYDTTPEVEDFPTDLEDFRPFYSVFIRKTFNIENINSILSATLHVDYDDGFVAYINGHEVARGSIGTVGVRPAWNDFAISHEGGVLERFDLDNAADLLVEGENTIAIQVHNVSTGSSDLTLRPFFTLKMNEVPEDANGVDPALSFESLISYMHTNFSISASGEKIILSDSAGILVDSVFVIPAITDISFARQTDGGLPWIMQLPTPGSINSGNEIYGISDVVTASLPNGFYATPISVELSTDEGAIFYTTDGSDPDSSSSLYTTPLVINETTLLKAVSIQPGYLPSEVLYHTYFINVETDLAVISLSSDPYNLFDYNYGIYEEGPGYTEPEPHFGANYWMDWERPAHIEFFDEDQNLAFSENCGIAIYGAWSRAHAQKSFSVKFRGIYGASSLQYRLFPNLDIAEYQSFILRNSGNDWPATMLRDAAMQYMVKDLDIDYLEYRPAVVFINGQYWGILNIREKISEHYVAARHGVDPQNIDMLENNASVIHGSADNYNDIINYIQSADMQSQDDYNYIANRIDLPEMITYFASEIYFNNRDWPGNNIKFWRERNENSKWRWILYDTDFGFNMYETGGQSENTLDFALATGVQGWPNPEYSTLLLRRLLLNPTIRTEFINQFADMLNTVFAPQTVVDLINTMNNRLNNEIDNHLSRWGQSSGNRESHINNMISFGQERPAHMRNHISSRWSLNGTSNITLNSSGGGRIKINTLFFDENTLPWNGQYFKNNPVTIRAIAEDGYKFAGWSGTVTSEDEILVFSPSQNYNLTASFSADSNGTREIVINEINYNSSDTFDSGDWIELYNYSANPVDLSNWVFSDENQNQFVFPFGSSIGSNSYLVIVNNDSAFNSRFFDVENYLSPMGFGLSGSGEFLVLVNDVGQIIDSLTYDDSPPWPTQADGGGSSLELMHHDLDNALGESWQASSNNGTPGMVNNGVTDITGNQNEFPVEFKLYQNYPNPFNGTTKIRFSLDKEYRVSFRIYDVSGKLLLNNEPELIKTGIHHHTVHIDKYASGVYFYQILLNGQIADTKKMILIR